MAKKVLYRSVFQVEVLSEEPIPDNYLIEDVISEYDGGDYSGKSTWKTKNVEVIGKRAARLTMEQGSDVEFFNMDANGNELEEEDYDEDEEDGLSGSMTMDEGWQY